jgi:acid stress-induced BolA-like protein IbaG/YrbA
MKNQKFKVLVYGNIFVDSNKLHQGIYNTLHPYLHDKSMTMEKLIVQYIGFYMMKI